MNLEFVRQVGRDNPTWLPTNIGSTCYAHTVELVRRLRAAGHQAFLICKTTRDGAQYAPLGFQRSTIKGSDGNDYEHTGFSHDAIWFDGAQFDTLSSANHYDRKIYKRQGEPNWSFDPADGPQITASAAWEEIPSVHWRPWNPPFTGEIAGTPGNPGTPIPSQPPAILSYEALGGDEGAKKITRVLEHDYKYAGRSGLDGDCGGWLRRTDYDVLSGKIKTVEESITKHRDEWLDGLCLIRSTPSGPAGITDTCLICGASSGRTIMDRMRPIPHAADCTTREKGRV